ncbi:MAG TPA: hypothetical protein VFL76_00895 [Edaphocola sp.]|nr:hypothetical protein [Edaphocola sp.]
MKKYIFIAVAIIMTSWFVWIVFNPPKNPDPNIYYFEGKIKDIIKSKNHDFGIIVVQLDTAHVIVKDSSFFVPSKDNFPPFRHHGDIGEVYCTVSVDPNINAIGYKIAYDTIDRSVEIIDNNNDTIAGAEMNPVSEPTDLKFILKNSRLK